MDKINNTFLFGLISGSIGALSVYPIDVVKTRMQNQISGNLLYKNGFDCCKKMWKSNGILSFYKGCIPQILGVGPEKAIKIYTYKTISNSHNDDFSYHVIGGLCAGAFQVIVTSPYEMLKINLQMNNKISFKHVLHFRNLYTGSFACFMRDIPFSGIYFPSYWYLKEKQNMNPFIAGTIAGAPAAFLCTPADVVKTRMQTWNGSKIKFSFIKMISCIWKNEGFYAFWKGAGWRVLRSSPQFGVTLLVYEYLNNN